MSEENTTQEFRTKDKNVTIHYLIKEINQNELISKKHKMFVEFWIILSTYLC